MKKYALLAVLILNCSILFSQNLITKYKTGRIKLVVDQSYGLNNDWDQVFRSYYDTLYHKPMGKRKSLIVLPDGSVIINHAYQKYHTLFSPEGKFKKEFKVEKASYKAIKGHINDNTLFTELDNMGEMTCSDFNGKYRKTLTLNYMTKEIIALNNNKFAVVAWVIWAKKFRTFVSIIDYNTNEEKVVWETFEDRNPQKHKSPKFNYSVKLKEGGMISCTTMPYSKSTGKGLLPQITSIDNELIVTVPNTGEILTYDLEGKLKNKNKVNWDNRSISVEEQKNIQKKAIKKYKEYLNKDNELSESNKDAFEKMIKEMEDDLQNIKTPIDKPFFSNIIKDSDNNILFFNIPKEKNTNIFHVWIYNKSKEFTGQCSFVCNDYNLVINSDKMVFKDGYIYSLQTLKNSSKNPLRLVRFSLETNKN